jgi:GntR family transcriptional repressor for pyruvate dehydrogenase complex
MTGNERKGSPVTSTDQRRRGQHQPVRVGTSIARELRERILSGEYVDSLPKQEALVEEFQVSAPSIREAFRVLEAEGLLTVRRGNVGGAVVRLPTTEDTAFALGLNMQARQTRVSDVAAALWNFEPVAVRLCAESEDRHDTVVPALRGSLDRLRNASASDDGEDIAQEFHNLLVANCGNQAIEAVMSSLYAIYHSHLDEYRETHGGSYVSAAEARATVVREHQAILLRIERGQADSAAKLASAHLQHLLTPLLDEDEIVSVTITRPRGRRGRRGALE